MLPLDAHVEFAPVTSTVPDEPASSPSRANVFSTRPPALIVRSPVPEFPTVNCCEFVHFEFVPVTVVSPVTPALRPRIPCTLLSSAPF